MHFLANKPSTVPSGLSVMKCNKTSIELGLPLFQSSEVTLYPLQYLQPDLYEWQEEVS